MPYNETPYIERSKNMQSLYSVYGSELQLILEDEFASAYNRAHDKFNAENPDVESLLKAKETTMTDEEIHAFNAFAALMNSMIEINGGVLSLYDTHCTSTHLIKIKDLVR
jgi:hypothetical protein